MGMGHDLCHFRHHPKLQFFLQHHLLNYFQTGLILLELFELAYINKKGLGDKIHKQLAKLKENNDLEQLICDGLDLIKKT